MTKDGTVSLTAGGNEFQKPIWQVELSPRSALGSDAHIRVQGDDNGGGLIEDLAEHLQRSGNDNGSPSFALQPAIPEAILNQIGNVACINVQTQAGQVQFSGFFIDREGLILCTAHDLREREEVRILTNTGVFYRGDIIKTDFSRDLALIRVDSIKEDVVSVSEGRNLLAMGEMVFSIGCPVNLRGTVQTGHINGPPRKVDGVPIWQATMKIEYGSSGSPVFDGSGVFVGVVKGRHREADDIAFMIPLEVIIDFLKDYFSS